MDEVGEKQSRSGKNFLGRDSGDGSLSAGRKVPPVEGGLFHSRTYFRKAWSDGIRFLRKEGVGPYSVLATALRNAQCGRFSDNVYSQVPMACFPLRSMPPSQSVACTPAGIFRYSLAFALGVKALTSQFRFPVARLMGKSGRRVCNRLQQSLHLFDGFDAGRLFDSRRYVQTVGIQGFDRLGGVFRGDAAG